jgi:hypothetical protein
MHGIPSAPAAVRAAGDIDDTGKDEEEEEDDTVADEDDGRG